MKLDKFAYLYSKPLGNHTLKIMKKIPGNLLKKTWKNRGNIMEFCQSEKSGNPVHCRCDFFTNFLFIMKIWQWSAINLSIVVQQVMNVKGN